MCLLDKDIMEAVCRGPNIAHLYWTSIIPLEKIFNVSEIRNSHGINVFVVLRGHEESPCTTVQTYTTVQTTVCPK